MVTDIGGKLSAMEHHNQSVAKKWVDEWQAPDGSMNK